MPGGQNKGCNPLDLFCGSFGTCQEITYKMYATVMGIELKSISAKVIFSFFSLLHSLLKSLAMLTLMMLVLCSEPLTCKSDSKA